MDTKLAAQLQQVGGGLSEAPGARPGELTRFRRAVTDLMATHPSLTVRGLRLSHEIADEAADAALQVAAAQAATAVATGTASTAAAAPLIFRRDTPFRSPLLGNSVPEWAAGLSPSQSFGPFVDEHGLPFWFDIYLPAELVSFTFAGTGAPVLRATVRRTLIGTRSYRLEAGSLWIASDALVRIAALQGFYTGLRIRGGTIDLSIPATVSSGSVVLTPATTLTVHVDLDQQPAPVGPHDAGIDAAESSVTLPTTLDLVIQLQATTLKTTKASCTAFGCHVECAPTGQAPAFIPVINLILVPFAAQSHTNNPAEFEIATSKSALCTVEGRAPIDSAGTGWVLPITKADPLTLGTAAGTGAMGIAMGKGLIATWKGLKGPRTTLLHPGVIVEPGLVTLLDFVASNPEGRLRWSLWRNSGNPAHSQVTLTFGKQFPFVFVSSAANSEGVFFFCGLKAELDRPVEANGRPFPINSPVAFAATMQIGSIFRAFLFDGELLEDELATQKAPRLHSVALRNAVFTVPGPRTVTLFGELVDGQIIKGTLTLTHDIALYLPTLPDPYVATYTPYLRDPAALGFGRPQQSLTGFVKWPDRSPAPPDLPAAEAADRAFVYFRLTPPLPPRAPRPATGRTFQNGVTSFDQDLSTRTPGATSLPTIAATTRLAATTSADAAVAASRSLEQRVNDAAQSGALAAAIAELANHPLLRSLPNASDQIARSLDTTVTAALYTENQDAAAAAGLFAPQAATTSVGIAGRGAFNDPLMLLDVSSHADQMGVTIGVALQVGDDGQGGQMIRRVDGVGALFAGAGFVPGGTALPLQIDNMDVVAPALNLRAATLPQISWEPVWNIPLEIEGAIPPSDTITSTPGLVVYDNDGIPTRIFSESPYQVPIAPLPVTRHFLKEYHDEYAPRNLHALFTLPFAMVAHADYTRHLVGAPEKSARLHFNMPHFGQLRGGLQVKALAPASPDPSKVGATFDGWTLQLDNNIRWALFGLPLTGSTLGQQVRDIFNQHFRPGGNRPEVPVEQMEFSGYGASIFSNWLSDASIADVSQVQFDVLMGRTAHEVVQVRSILYPFGVHLVRTITLTRSNNGYVFRSDSGWKAESDGFYDFSYNVDLVDKVAGTVTTIHVPNPFEFHTQPVKGVSNVREIRDFADAGAFTSSFPLDDPDLPPQLLALSLADWKKVFQQVTSKSDVMPVQLQAVVFDADVHLDNVSSGGAPSGGDFIVQSRRMIGYVQIAPASILIPARIFADLLNFQHGSLGGPVDCAIDIGKSRQTMRLSRVDVSPAKNAAGKSVFVTAGRGSLVLPPDGSWSVVTQNTTTGDVSPLAPGDSGTAHQAQREPELPDRASGRCVRADLERAFRRAAVHRHTEDAVRRAAGDAGHRQAEKRTDVFRRRLQAAQLEGTISQRRQRAGADRRRARSRGARRRRDAHGRAHAQPEVAAPGELHLPVHRRTGRAAHLRPVQEHRQHRRAARPRLRLDGGGAGRPLESRAQQHAHRRRPGPVSRAGVGGRPLQRPERREPEVRQAAPAVRPGARSRRPDPADPGLALGRRLRPRHERRHEQLARQLGIQVRLLKGNPGHQVPVTARSSPSTPIRR